jgi:predicted O-linked N-acetylglucosamine transferase (SPINDLY family)
MYRMRLHDGILRQARFLVKTILLKNPDRAAPAPKKGAQPPDRKSDRADSEPRDANEWARQADNHLRFGRFTEATEASDRALALDPQHFTATRIGIDSRIFSCDWRRREEDKRSISEGLRAGERLVGPLNHRAICSSEAEHLLFAQLRAKKTPPAETPLWRGELYRHDKIRIAYISTDFRDHVLASAIAGCFEYHDKTRFEITAISLSPDDGSEMRQRIKRAVDRFIDVQTMSDAQVATMLRELEIDIAIDQNGYSGAGRTGIVARRPAPVQVNYLAYPGTMGVPFIDYIIADRLIIPEGNRQFYSEQVAYLPHTYLPTDSKRPIADRTPSRLEAGLPESGFVFVCNNNAHKIGPEIFHIWMRLLKAVDGSVLWLSALSPATRINLRREASACGVAPRRLVFAPKIPKIEDHLARLRLGDLFLDTLPYNAHATASDALWTGLPVLTCLGDTFPSCVAAAAVHAIGLPELATKSLAEYEGLALALARNPERLRDIKSQLMRNRHTQPLFDTAQFTRDLESAYMTMFKRQQAGLPPECFAVAST